jgi:hypothetical protein
LRRKRRQSTAILFCLRRKRRQLTTIAPWSTVKRYTGRNPYLPRWIILAEAGHFPDVVGSFAIPQTELRLWYSIKDIGECEDEISQGPSDEDPGDNKIFNVLMS